MTMDLFYAYVKRIDNDWAGRYLAVFANRAIADEWWRAVSTSPVTKFSTVCRVTPHFYTHDPDRADAHIITTLTTPNVATQFLGSVFFTLLQDRDGRYLNVIPPSLENITDHISGNWFFIRTKGDNPVYWYSTADGQIIASRTRSTRFCIDAADKSLRGAVLVRNDQVYITLSGNLSLSVSAQGSLQSGGKAEAFRFGDFLDGFCINAYGSDLLPGVSAGAIVTTRRNDAQEWQLSESGVFGDLD